MERGECRVGCVTVHTAGCNGSMYLPPPPLSIKLDIINMTCPISLVLFALEILILCKSFWLSMPNSQQSRGVSIPAFSDTMESEGQC
jgi:hypothetical protein